MDENHGNGVFQKTKRMNDQKQSKIFGKLYFPEDGSEITAVWLFLDSVYPYLEVPIDTYGEKSWEIIHGSFNGLDNVTLVDCDLGGGSLPGGSGGGHRKIHFTYMFKHHHFNSKSDIKFNKVSFSSTALNKWISREFSLEYTHDNLKIPQKKSILQVKTKMGVFDMFLGFDASIGFLSAELNRKSTIEFQFSNEQQLGEIQAFLLKLRRLILFLTHESPGIERYVFSSDSVKDIIQPEYSPFNNLSGFSSGIDLRYSSVKENLEVIVKNWIEKDELIQIVELIQEKYMNTSLSFQNYFLNCCVSLESYHQRIVKKGYSEEIKQKIKTREQQRKTIASLISNTEILKQFNDGTNDWKKPTLKERLEHFKDLISRIKPDVIDLTYDQFIQKIVQTRNKIAHEGEYLKYMTEFELFLFGKVLEFTMKIELLQSIGFGNQSELDRIAIDSRKSIEHLARINNYAPASKD